MEESEKRFEEELEKLENEPTYIHASYEKFSSNPIGIGAKYLWLKYTLLEKEVPKDVMERMIKTIKYDIQFHEKKHTSYGALSKEEIEKQVYELLEFAMEKPDEFWEILYAPGKNILVSQFDEDLLKETRLEFPHKRNLKPGELYEFFGKQLGIDQEKSEYSIGERMRDRYRKIYKKNKKNEELLFK